MPELRLLLTSRSDVPTVTTAASQQKASRNSMLRGTKDALEAARTTFFRLNDALAHDPTRIEIEAVREKFIAAMTIAVMEVDQCGELKLSRWDPFEEYAGLRKFGLSLRWSTSTNAQTTVTPQRGHALIPPRRLPETQHGPLSKNYYANPVESK